MTTEFLSLLCLGLCLGYEDEKKNEKLPKPSLHARPSSVVEARSNVTLKCQAPSKNVTFILLKVNDSGYKQEQFSTEDEAEFHFTDLKLEDAGSYFCAYKTTASREGSESSEHLELVITDKHDELEAPSMKTDTRTIFVAIFSCISILLLFLSVFIIYRCSQHGSSPEESTKRISHSKLSEQVAAEADLSRMERVSVSTADPQGVTYAELNINALSEAASDTTQEPPGSHEYAAVKV
ncbi:V-set and transmembrane domain-containing protein 1 isoform X1 [Macaca thibetana thibetana]|uniref:V-set and transmembrane domain-containing protein 1 isoform X1 n=1 Tax=Macaca thibetana thibetana TaxID=257877 RepID=UPI0021BCCFB8|nr:V-set and transmembrane domain-containing protein 1 isoform X1 [Macaca thibetana thibetana]